MAAKYGGPRPSYPRARLSLSKLLRVAGLFVGSEILFHRAIPAALFAFCVLAAAAALFVVLHPPRAAAVRTAELMAEGMQ